MFCDIQQTMILSYLQTVGLEVEKPLSFHIGKLHICLCQIFTLVNAVSLPFLLEASARTEWATHAFKWKSMICNCQSETVVPEHISVEKESYIVLYNLINLPAFFFCSVFLL